jgi:RimJ/RimL family protein N-acetyltransferase
MPAIETPRLRLRSWTDADVEDWAAMNADPRVMEFFPAPIPHERSRESAALMREELERNGYGWFVLERKDAPGFGGVIAITEVRWEAPFEPKQEIGWRLPVHMWGQGFATEAAAAAMDFAFHELDWPEIVAFTSRLNLRSMRVMEKIGMVRDVQGDFEHPRVPEGHRIRPHVLYRKKRPAL